MYSTATISRWICINTVDNTSWYLGKKQGYQKISKLTKSMQWPPNYSFFNKKDMQTVMKAGTWSSGGTFTSFYLRDLCPQADHIRQAGPVVAT